MRFGRCQVRVLSFRDFRGSAAMFLSDMSETGGTKIKAGLDCFRSD